MFHSILPLNQLLFALLEKYASFIPDVSMLPRNTMLCLPRLFCIMWHIACLGALLMYSIYLWDDQETNLLMTKEGGSCGSLHISIYCFTLEKSFTLFEPPHFKKKKKPLSPGSQSGWHALFINVCHGCSYWIMEFESILCHRNRIGFGL